MSYPQHWPDWPFLPLVRGDTSDPLVLDAYEVGVLFDVFHLHGQQWRVPGYSATVFKQNKNWLPELILDVLYLPQEQYDTIEEVLIAGWRPDIGPLQGVQL